MMSTKDLFALLTYGEDWYKGYCSHNRAQVIKHRHKNGKLGVRGYELLFEHFGYTKFWKKK